MLKKIIPVICLLYCSNAFAQPFTMNPNIVPTELNLYDFKPDGKENLKGKLNVTEVTQVKDTLYFFAKGFSIYAPAYAGITMEDKSNDVEVGFFKENWLKPSRSGNTGAQGHWEDKFKTEGDFGIRVIAKTKPAKYSIVVWTGNDVEVKVPNAFTYKEGGVGSGGGGIGGFFKKNYLYVILGLLVVGLLIVLLRMKKKTSGASTPSQT